MAFRIECRPAFNYARDQHSVELSSGGACFHSPELSLGLATHIPLTQDGDGVRAELVLKEGETATFVLQGIPRGAGCGIALSEPEAMALFQQTVVY